MGEKVRICFLFNFFSNNLLCFHIYIALCKYKINILHKLVKCLLGFFNPLVRKLNILHGNSLQPQHDPRCLTVRRCGGSLASPSLPNHSHSVETPSSDSAPSYRVVTDNRLFHIQHLLPVLKISYARGPRRHVIVLPNILIGGEKFCEAGLAEVISVKTWLRPLLRVQSVQR
jgi:hypothetical protein